MRYIAANIRTFLSEFNQPYSKVGRVESVKEVLKNARKVAEAEESFDYGSPVTQALVILTEAITQKKWADYFDGDSIDCVGSTLRALLPFALWSGPL